MTGLIPNSAYIRNVKHDQFLSNHDLFTSVLHLTDERVLFNITRMSDGKYTLESNGWYICSANRGNVTCNRTEAKEWEKFYLRKDSRYFRIVGNRDGKCIYAAEHGAIHHENEDFCGEAALWELINPNRRSEDEKEVFQDEQDIEPLTGEDAEKIEQLKEKLSGLRSVLAQLNRWDHDRWSETRGKAMQKTLTAADILQKVTRDAGIAHASGGGGAIIGGITIVVGIITVNPVAVAGGAILTAAGGVTSLVADVVKYGWEKSESNNVQEILEEDRALTEEFSVIIKGLKRELEILRDDAGVMDILNYIRRSGMSALSVYNALSGLAFAREAMAFVAAFEGLEAFGRFYATFRGLTLDLTLLNSGWRFVLIEAGEAGAVLFAKVNAALAIVFGALDVFRGVKELVNGNEQVAELRSAADSLMENEQKVERIYQAFQVDRWSS